jgi:hypothetical protein
MINKLEAYLVYQRFALVIYLIPYKQYIHEVKNLSLSQGLNEA